MKIIHYTLFTLLAISYAQGQNIAFADGYATYGRENSFISIDADTRYDVEGSKFTFEGFKSAKVSNMPDKLFNIRFNAFTGDMEVEGANNKIYALNKYRKDFLVTFQNSKNSYQVFDYFNSDKEMKTRFFLVLNEGNNKLLLQEKVIFLKEKVSKTGYDAHRPPQYKRIDDQFFIKVPNNENAMVLPKNKKKFAELFPGNKTEILSFIKSSNIKLNKQQDLLKLINYVNSL